MRCYLVVLVLGLAACTRHMPVNDVADVAGHDDVYVETYANEHVTVIATPGPTGLVFHTSNEDTLDNGQIKRVVEIQRGRGALQGLGIGLLIGAVAGFALGYSEGDDKCPTDDCWLTFSAQAKGIFGAIGIGGLGGIAGLIVGAIRGAHDVYDFDGGGPAPTPRVMPSGPPGSVMGMTVTF